MAERKDPRRDDDDEQDPAPKKASGGSSVLKILLVVLAMIVLAAGSALGALYVAGAGPFAAQVADEDGDGKEDDSNKADKKKKKNKKKEKDKSAQDGKAETVTYLPLDPPFVVNLENPTEARFLQVSMEVMTRDAQVVEDIKRHMPAIRHHLVLLLSSQNYATLASAEGKERIRAEALAAVQKILQEHTGKPGVEALYFTGFVMQ